MKYILPTLNAVICIFNLVIAMVLNDIICYYVAIFCGVISAFGFLIAIQKGE